MLRDELKKEILKISGLQDAKITEPEHAENGDWTTNAAFSLAKKIGKSPNDAAEDLADKLRSEKSDVVDRAESVGGFINIWIKDEVLLLSLGVVTKIRSKNTKINLEFVSANPTGPLTMAKGRGGFYGDALANILEKTGYDVTREYYINDAGNQVRLLGESIEAAEGKREDKNLIEKKDGAIWLGEAVLVKSDGEYTYFLVDLAYHWNKFFDRKFDMAVDIWGADHHGYVERMKKGVEALGIGPEKLKIIIMQLVRLMSEAKEVKMSKRAGTFVTME